MHAAAAALFCGYSGCISFGLVFALSYAIPLIVIGVFFVVVFIRRNVTQTTAENITCATGNADAAAERRRATKLVVAVVVAFAILWFPHLVRYNNQGYNLLCTVKHKKGTLFYCDKSLYCQ